MKNLLTFTTCLFLLGCDVEDYEFSEDSEFRAKVTSNGVFVGYLLGASRYTFSLLDSTKTTLFQINPETGYLVGAPLRYYTTNNCSGDFYLPSGLPPELCPADIPGRQVIVSDSGDGLGLILPTLSYESGFSVIINQGSVMRNGVCSQFVDPYCLITTSLINMDPTFDLPIKTVF